MFKRVVNVVELLALAGVVVFVVFLFANEPGHAGGPGAQVFSANCARCHGADGGGYIGPQLSHGKVKKAFPNVEDQIKLVTDGRGGMPAFGGQLSEDKIREVVEYTRTL